MVRQNILSHVKPEFGHLSKDSAFLCDLVFQNNVETADAVGCHKDQAVAIVINLTDFSFFDWFHLHTSSLSKYK